MYPEGQEAWSEFEELVIKIVAECREYQWGINSFRKINSSPSILNRRSEFKSCRCSRRRYTTRWA